MSQITPRFPLTSNFHFKIEGASHERTLSITMARRDDPRWLWLKGRLQSLPWIRQRSWHAHRQAAGVEADGGCLSCLRIEAHLASVTEDDLAVVAFEMLVEANAGSSLGQR